MYIEYDLLHTGVHLLWLWEFWIGISAWWLCWTGWRNPTVLFRSSIQVWSPLCSIQSQWSYGLRCGSAAAPLLGLWVRIPPRAWMSVSCECCMLSGRGLYDGLINRPEESYRVWCVWVWSWILENEEALAHWGAGAPKKTQRKIQGHRKRWMGLSISIYLNSTCFHRLKPSNKKL